MVKGLDRSYEPLHPSGRWMLSFTTPTQDSQHNTEA
jgi:hypothetical protein